MQFDTRHHHIFHYSILGIVLFAWIVVFYQLRYQPQAQVSSILALCFLYIAWGIVHHAIVEKRLHRSVVVEYILISLVGLALLLILFL